MPPEQAASAPRRLRVLVADDHPGIVKAVTRLLTLSYDVAGSVADGSGLLAAAQQLRPDVIVLDVNLPNVDGLKACRQITQALPEMKVVVFTAVDDPDVRRRASRPEPVPSCTSSRSPTTCWRPWGAWKPTGVDPDRRRAALMPPG